MISKKCDICNVDIVWPVLEDEEWDIYHQMIRDFPYVNLKATIIPSGSGSLWQRAYGYCAGGW